MQSIGLGKRRCFSADAGYRDLVQTGKVSVCQRQMTRVSNGIRQGERDLNERGPVQTKWGFVAKLRLLPERGRKNPLREW